MLTIYSRSSRENTVTDVLLGVSGTVFASALAVQFFTEADPFGSCVRFWKQLGVHVSEISAEIVCVREYSVLD
jgi:hypothetical protein